MGGKPLLIQYRAKPGDLVQDDRDQLLAAEPRIDRHQEDHVRLYGMDFFDRLKETGFTVTTHTHAECLPDIDPLRYGVNGEEQLILCTKP